MSNLSKEEIFKLAELAKIGINDEEASGYMNDINNILGYVSQVTNFEVKDESKILQFHSVVREDKERESGNFSHDLIMRNIPHKSDDGYVKVAKVIQK